MKNKKKTQNENDADKRAAACVILIFCKDGMRKWRIIKSE